MGFIADALDAGAIGPSPDLDDSWFDWARRRPSDRPADRGPTDPPAPLESLRPSIDPTLDDWFRG